MSIGKQIAASRKQMNLTQEQLGQIVGVSNQSVSKWESEVSSPDISLIPAIAKALNVNIADLFECENENCRNDTQKEAIIDTIKEILPEIVQKAVSEALDSRLSELLSQINEIKCVIYTVDDVVENAIDGIDFDELSEKVEDVSEMLEDLLSRDDDGDPSGSPHNKTSNRHNVLMVVSPYGETSVGFEGIYNLRRLGNGNWQIFAPGRHGGSIAQYPSNEEAKAREAMKTIMEAYEQGQKVLYL